MSLTICSGAGYPREMLRAVRDWRAKQTSQERIRWDQIWDYFRADRCRLRPGTVYPTDKSSSMLTPCTCRGRDPAMIPNRTSSHLA
jgi:hypothetical protein